KPKPAIIDDYVVRKVFDGVALVEGRRGIIEVEPGSTLPGAGRVEEIRRQDGRWVVVTNKGLIVSARSRSTHPGFVPAPAPPAYAIKRFCPPKAWFEWQIRADSLPAWTRRRSGNNASGRTLVPRFRSS